jgi:hypothetical protein
LGPGRRWKKEWGLMGIGTGLVLLSVVATGSGWAQSSQPARQIVDTMLVHEADRNKHGNNYMYVSEERSERTGGHLWTERVVETTSGKLRLLEAEDGRPLSAERAGLERAGLDDVAAHRDAFERSAQTVKSDEAHAERMLELLGKAYVFGEPRVEGEDLRIPFQPDPAYQPQTLEERVLHGMTGSILVDRRTMYLHSIEAKLPGDVSLGYGLLGSVHAGSNFSTTHEIEPGTEWKTTQVNTAINGKVLFFKAIGKNAQVVHHDFKLLPNDVSVAQAVAMLER